LYIFCQQKTEFQIWIFAGDKFMFGYVVFLLQTNDIYVITEL
jgi:hypothetical protein